MELIDSAVPWRRSRPRRPPSSSYLMPRVRGFRVRTRDLPYEREALTQWGRSEVGAQRPVSGPDPFPPRVDQCARGWGSTGRGLCVLHEPPTPMEYARRSCSGAPPSWSGHWAAGGIDFAGLWGGAGRVGRRRVRTLCRAFGGSGYERATYPTNARAGLSWLGVVCSTAPQQATQPVSQKS